MRVAGDRSPGWWQGWYDAREVLLESGGEGPTSVRFRDDVGVERAGAARHPAPCRRDVLDHIDGAWAFLRGDGKPGREAAPQGVARARPMIGVPL